MMMCSAFIYATRGRVFLCTRPHRHQGQHVHSNVGGPVPPTAWGYYLIFAATEGEDPQTTFTTANNTPAGHFGFGNLT